MKRIIMIVAVGGLAGGALTGFGQQRQRSPISITGTQITQPITGPASSARLVSTNILSSSANQLVLAVHLDSNYMAIEEWDSTLSNRVDRATIVPGTQSVVWATADYAAMAKSFNTASNSVNFVATLDSVDDDWDDDGTSDHYGSVTVVGTIRYSPTGTLTNRNGSTIITGIVSSVSATIQGPLNDILGGEDTPELQLRNGRLRTTSTKPFLVND